MNVMLHKRKRPAGRTASTSGLIGVLVAALSLLTACSSSSSTSSGGSGVKGPGSSNAPASSGSAAGVDATLHAMLPQNIQSSGVVTFAITLGFPPVQYLDANNQQTGYTIDLGNALGQVLGVKVKFVRTEFNALIAGVLAKRFDGVMGAVNITPARTKQIIMVSYDNAANGILVGAGNPHNITGLSSLCGLRVATLIGSTNADILKTQSQSLCVGQGHPAIQVDTYSDTNSSFQAVESGRADAHFDNYIAVQYAAQKSGGKLSYVKSFYYPNGEHGVGFAPDNLALAKAFQAAFDEIMQNGAYDAVLKKWDFPSWVKQDKSKLLNNTSS